MRVYEANKDNPEFTDALVQALAVNSGIAKWQQDGDIEWGFNEQINILVFRGNKATACPMMHHDHGKTPWKRYCKSVRYVVVSYGVSSVSDSAFSTAGDW